MKSLISIVVPIYKVPEKYLTNCINSLTNQSYKNIEIILVDDGSPDDCGLICDKFAENDLRIKVIHKKNGGLCSARNCGVDHSVGEYIMFVDGDDWLASNACEVLINNMESDIDILCASFVKDYGNKKINYKYDFFEDNKKYLSSEELLFMRRMVLNFTANISSVTAKLIRRKLIVDNNIYHNDLLKQGAEGIDFIYRLFKSSAGIKFINKYVYYYVYNDQSISTNFTEKNAYMILNCFKEIKKNINEDDCLYFDNRLLYVIVTSVTSGFLNPAIIEKFDNRISNIEKYLSDELFICALNNKKAISMLDKKRKFVINLIIRKKYKLLFLSVKIKKIIKGVK